MKVMLDTNSHPVTCPVCGCYYVPNDEEDIAMHKGYHSRWRAATSLMKYEPAGRTECERMKDAGRKLMREAKTEEELVAGAESLYRGWYDRSFRSAIRFDYYQNHPDFAAYMAMNELEKDVPQAAAALRKKYGYGNSTVTGYIDESYWREGEPDEDEAAA